MSPAAKEYHCSAAHHSTINVAGVLTATVTVGRGLLHWWSLPTHYAAAVSLSHQGALKTRSASR
jgi:hypothetical protein